MSLRHGLLGLLTYSSNTGYELDKIFKDSLYFFWKVQTSQLYRELSAMEAAGLLSSKIIYQTNSPNKKVYSVTEAGKIELQRWLTETENTLKHDTRNAFLMKLFFSGYNAPEESIRLLQQFSESNTTLLNDADKISANITRYATRVPKETSQFWEFVADYGQRIRQLNVEWAMDCIEKIKAAR